MDVFSSFRYTGLIKSGAVRAENRPIWYDVYKHFKPSVEPLAIRPEPVRMEVKPIFYREDVTRAKAQNQSQKRNEETTMVHHIWIDNIVSEIDCESLSLWCYCCQ